MCTELVQAYPCYWENHPGCIPNEVCEGSYFQCNDSCPAPDSDDMCLCDGSAGGWNGCDGGCVVCNERVSDFACYYINHPACSSSDASCGGSFSQCNARCPAPTAADRGTGS